jgi:hypothetical protein
MAYIKKGSCKPPILNERRSILFDRSYKPGRQVTCSGIYRCICNREILCHANEKFPFCDDHGFPEVAWMLIVSIDDIPDTSDWTPENEISSL